MALPTYPVAIPTSSSIVAYDRNSTAYFFTNRQALPPQPAVAGMGVGALVLLVGTVGFFTSGYTVACVTAVALAAAAVIGVVVVRSIIKGLYELVHGITDGAEHVSSAATQIASASQSLAEGTSQQAASLEEKSASTEEINSMARRNSENSNSAAGLVKQSEQRFADTNRSL